MHTPNNEVTCPDCHNDGFKYCPTCEGLGKILESDIPLDIIVDVTTANNKKD